MKKSMVTTIVLLLSCPFGWTGVIVEGQVNKRLESKSLAGKSLSSISIESQGFTPFAFYVIVCHEAVDAIEVHKFRVGQLGEAGASDFILSATDRIWVCARPTFETKSLLPSSWQRWISESVKPTKDFDHTTSARRKPAEQAGAVQPATDPESKSEGDEKLQPESKPAPR